MSYKLEKPYKENDRLDFIVKYNHEQGLHVHETESALYALEAWEKLEGDTVIDNREEYEQEQAILERERISKLSLTKREVFLALYRNKGITPDALRAQITDPEALIEFDFAENYFRGNPLIDKIGIMLGYSMEDLDHLFETGELPEKVDNETPPNLPLESGGTKGETEQDTTEVET
ncbi:MAG: hypothetical protein NC191_04775 [Muribaculaceae bacterium]|nr:hypothetical protein [Muribaculaceae bacterium]